MHSLLVTRWRLKRQVEKLSMMESSLIMIKPDAYQRDLVPKIKDAIYDLELKITRTKKISLDRWDILELWPKIHTLWGWLSSQQYIVGHTLEVWEICGDDAVEKICNLKKQLREIYCDPKDAVHTLIHAPDSSADFIRERKLLFDI